MSITHVLARRLGGFSWRKTAVADLSDALGASPLKVFTVTLTDAEIKAAPTAPMEILPAVAGKAYLPVDVVAVANFAAAYEDVVSPTLKVKAESQFGTIILWADNGDIETTLGSTGHMVRTWMPDARSTYGDDDGSTLDSFPLNLELGNGIGGTDPFTGGDPANTLKLTVWYYEIPL